MCFCGEKSRQVDAIQIGTHNICLYKEKKQEGHDGPVMLT